MNNMVHASNIQKSIVCGSLLSKNKFKLVFKSNKFILIKSGMVVGKVYSCDELFKLNVMTIVSKSQKDL